MLKMFFVFYGDRRFSHFKLHERCNLKPSLISGKVNAQTAREAVLKFTKTNFKTTIIDLTNPKKCGTIVKECFCRHGKRIIEKGGGFV